MIWDLIIPGASKLSYYIIVSTVESRNYAPYTFSYLKFLHTVSGVDKGYPLIYS